ncbi:PfkB family carbohydrate kinase [Amycolatopsis regifaucium]|uniref:PfkB family carbohydrate kinase n=1 Tax=Amycolatopsis regifaucium TaxID=546365 RepID=UPI0008F66954|nr:PfkB family carbohydrate kinase [Amycolatopsis regifaucium]SFH94328.1 Sugar or nucleoside kinase, ribokinase family [Amycolatopsis regifaucium]
MLLAGLCTVDQVQRVAEIPAPGEKVRSLSMDVAAGGPATNAAVTVAALGAEATLLTVAGAHPLAALARADLDAHGVDLVDLDPGQPDPPAISAVVVRESDGERTVVSRNAHASSRSVLSMRSLHAQLPRLEDEMPRCVLLDGHHPEIALHLARWARERKVPVVLDAGSWKPVFGELLPLVDIAACSSLYRGDDPRAYGVPVVITTAGPEPVRWTTADGSGAVPVPVTQARDTLGAGDVWHGAFAYAVARGVEGLQAWIGFANEVAAERVRHEGPRSWTASVAKMGEGLP